MRASYSFLIPSTLFSGLSSAGWREECDFGGNGQFNIIHAKPYLSTLCPSSTGRQICTMLDLGYCLMNSLGHLTATINGHFERSCENCHLTGRNNTVLSCKCRSFGKNAPWLNAEIDLEDLIENRDGRLACWDSKPRTCPGFDMIE